MKTEARILVAGRNTLVGSALCRELARQGCRNVIPDPADEPDWTDAGQVEALFAGLRPEFVFLAAGRSGGIGLNRERPADLMAHNLRVDTLAIECARRFGARKLLYLASSCCYPRDCPQPMKPERLLTGPLEPTNEAYALAKLAGTKLCQACRAQYGSRFIVGIPATPFGPGDHFDVENSHVIGALIRRMHEARVAGDSEIVLWGTGTPRRDFLFADDLADACIRAMECYDEAAPINLGPNEDISIAELAGQIRSVTGFRGALRFDASKPDGMPRKFLDAAVLRDLGWTPRHRLADALAATYDWFRAHCAPAVPNPAP
jgi:GDP-L-fucose synthase